MNSPKTSSEKSKSSDKNQKLIWHLFGFFQKQLLFLCFRSGSCLKLHWNLMQARYIMMPELGGVEASREIRSISSAPILFLTAKSQERDMLQAYQSGGDDYLVKPFSSAELLMRVESLLRRYRVYKGKINGKILRQDIVLDEENRRVLRDGAAVELTETEFSILQYLAAQKGKVVSVNDIYENVWHEKYMPASNNTVMVHIVNLRKKLERNPAEPRLIRTVWGKGYQID